MEHNIIDLEVFRPATIGVNGDPRQTIVGTELVTFPNRDGMRLVGFHDYPNEGLENGRWMIVLPGYGETKTDVIATSYFLAKNGFHTLRFDYSWHVGESDGDIISTNLEAMKNDLLSSVDYLYRRFRSKEIGVVASSLASRALLRAAREDERIRLLLNLVSVVDVRKTLYAIYQEDYFDRVKRGVRVGVLDVLGFQVDADSFLRSAIENGYDDLNTTMEDLKHITAPIVFFAAEKDEWVELDDVRRAVYACPGKRRDWQILDGAMHELNENSEVARKTLREVVRYAGFFLFNQIDFNGIKQPNLREIGLRIRKEKKRNKLIYATSKDQEREFWKSYLENYSFIVNVPDYWDLMALVYSLLGEIKSCDRILDAGCGIGNFGTYHLIRLLYAARNQPIVPSRCQSPSIHYVGVDFVRAAIEQARRTHTEIEEEFIQRRNGWSAQPLINRSYGLVDLDFPLPFQDNSFEKICCNLVVSYLRDPAEAIAKLAKLLKNEGTIVVTSLKPFADLSQIYRNFIKTAKSKTDIEEGRKLLSNAGRVKSKQAQGLYQFFSEEVLTNMLKEAGLHDVETYRSLGNQANVAIGTKK